MKNIVLFEHRLGGHQIVEHAHTAAQSARFTLLARSHHCFLTCRLLHAHTPWSLT